MNQIASLFFNFTYFLLWTCLFPFFFHLIYKLYHNKDQKAIDLRKIFKKNFCKKTWQTGAEYDIIKGEVFFFFFFFLFLPSSANAPRRIAAQLLQRRLACRARRGGSTAPDTSWCGRSYAAPISYGVDGGPVCPPLLLSTLPNK